MSAIQARIHAFESLNQDKPAQAGSRKPPIKLYDSDPEDSNADRQPQDHKDAQTVTTSHPNESKELDDEAQNLVVGSITSDFVKVSPPRSKPPRLPPRKTSENTSSTPSTPSIDESFTSSYSPKSSSLKGPPTPRPIPPKRPPGHPSNKPEASSSSSLTIDPRYGRGHAHTVSSSSFHSVSLSDNDQAEKAEVEHGLGGSYEAVSPHASSVFSLVEKTNSIASSPALSSASLAPPALPPRPSSIAPGGHSPGPTTPSEITTNSAPVPYAVRKVPPPPPSSALRNKLQTRGSLQRPPPLEEIPQNRSARSSVASISTMTSITASPSNSSLFTSADKRSSRASTSTVNSSFNNSPLIKRKPPPMPPSARARYDAVFDGNFQVQQDRKKLGGLTPNSSIRTRRAVGWRGTSVDLTTSGSIDHPLSTASGSQSTLDESEPTLNGHVVRLIWSCSRLPRETLKQIWNECDPSGKGSLSKQAFANGMWRIDNELLAGASLRTAGFSSSNLRTTLNASQSRR
ncbi:hypothetical protein CPB86DRAFT_704193 [Serendipita vermifera]|nr:hypothetical protein CPB86DRAFT_704193 [Serendipita vermifera]